MKYNFFLTIWVRHTRHAIHNRSFAPASHKKQQQTKIEKSFGMFTRDWSLVSWTLSQRFRFLQIGISPIQIHSLSDPSESGKTASHFSKSLQTDIPALQTLKKTILENLKSASSSSASWSCCRWPGSGTTEMVPQTWYSGYLLRNLKRYYEYDLTRDVGSGGDGGDVWLMTPEACLCRCHMHVSADVGCMFLQTSYACFCRWGRKISGDEF